MKPIIKVLIGVPSFFSIDPHFHVCLLNLFGWLSRNKALLDLDEKHPGLGIADGVPRITGEIVHNFGDSPNVGRARNTITAKFLAGDFTDLLMIDSDIIFSPAHVARILSHADEVVGGLYMKKKEGAPEPVINGLNNAIVRDDGLAQVGYMGTGFLRIKRAVFEEMIERFGEDIWYTVDGQKERQYNFWHLGIYKYPNEARRWLSEDWWFCQRCADLGIRVWADRQIVLRHSGNAVYPLSYQENQVFGREQSRPVAVADAISPVEQAAV